MSICDKCRYNFRNGIHNTCFKREGATTKDVTSCKDYEPEMNVCDKCKYNREDFEICGKGENKVLTKQFCRICYMYEPFTNRDMLEKKIHEMSDEDIEDKLIKWIGEDTSELEECMSGIMGKRFYDNYNIQDWLSQPYEEEKNYVVYRVKNDEVAKRLYYKSESEYRSYKCDATELTLQQANKKRNELNDKEPLCNWCVEVV